MAVEKHEIRAEKACERSMMGDSERVEKTGEIRQKLFSLAEFSDAESAAFYVGVENEVNTLGMIREALEMKKRIFVPVTDFRKKEMHLCELRDLDDLEERKLSSGKVLLEPKKGKHDFVDAKEVSLVIVPLVAFDDSCHRVGSGAGFYDRYLKKIEEHVPTIGLAFECQRVDSIPAEEHDVPLKKIVTEKRLIQCPK